MFSLKMMCTVLNHIELWILYCTPKWRGVYFIVILENFKLFSFEKAF